MGGCIIKGRDINRVTNRFGLAGEKERLSSPQIVQSTKSVRHTGGGGGSGGSGDIKWVQLDQEEWVIDTSYVEDDRPSNDGGLYTCIADHTSDADKEPGVGVDWESYWEKSSIMMAKDAEFDGSSWAMSGEHFDVYAYPQPNMAEYINGYKIVVLKSGEYWVALSNAKNWDDFFATCT